MKKPNCRIGSSCGYACIEKKDVCQIIFGEKIGEILSLKAKARELTGRTEDDDDLTFFLQQKYTDTNVEIVKKIINNNVKNGVFDKEGFDKELLERKILPKKQQQPSYNRMVGGWAKILKHTDDLISTGEKEKAKKLLEMAIGTLAPNNERFGFRDVNENLYNRVLGDDMAISRMALLFASSFGNGSIRETLPTNEEILKNTNPEKLKAFREIVKSDPQDKINASIKTLLPNELADRVLESKDLMNYISGKPYNKRIERGLDYSDKFMLDGFKSILPYYNKWTDDEVDMFMDILPKPSDTKGGGAKYLYLDDDWLDLAGLNRGELSKKNPERSRNQLNVKRYMEQLGRDPIFGTFIPFHKAQWDHILAKTDNALGDFIPQMLVTGAATNNLKSTKSYLEAFEDLYLHAVDRVPWKSASNKFRKEYDKKRKSKRINTKDRNAELLDSLVSMLNLGADVSSRNKILEGLEKKYSNFWDKKTYNSRSIPGGKLISLRLETLGLYGSGVTMHGKGYFTPGKDPDKKIGNRVHFLFTGLKNGGKPANKFIFEKLLDLDPNIDGELIKRLSTLYGKGQTFSQIFDLQRPKNLPKDSYGFINIDGVELVFGPEEGAKFEREFNNDLDARRNKALEELKTTIPEWFPQEK